ncbi:MAG TPA: SH3 domain-containing protein [Micromonosporaceae bacterium]|nr:SH3 domain-containing protein [Micromonosporaceae bacterium]
MAWPDGSTEQSAEAAPTGTSGGSLDRGSALSRGSVNRAAPYPSTSPSVSLSTPEATETPEPEKTESETPTPEPEPEPTVAGQMFVTTALNVRSGAGSHTSVLTVLARGTEVDITGETDGDWVQILHDGDTAWVNGEYLSETEPADEPEETSGSSSGGGLSMEACATGSSVESGLTQDAIRVHRAVCAEFPDISTYHGVRSGGGAHGAGRALDIMVSNSAQGDAIAKFVQDNYKALGVSEIIWSQRIWTVQRSGEGWRWMEDRGSATANHYDHVHVTVYGNSGG